MKVAIIGSRNRKQIDISRFVPKETTEIICSSTKWIYSIAKKIADERDVTKRIIKLEYAKYKKITLLKQNEAIVDASDMIIIIWDGNSDGARYIIDYALKIGKPIKVHFID